MKEAPVIVAVPAVLIYIPNYFERVVEVLEFLDVSLIVYNSEN